MRRWQLAGIGLALLVSAPALAKKDKRVRQVPTQFAMGRYTFFDFGPPFNYYEIFLVSPAPDGTSITRITVTPAIKKCTLPAKVEVATGSVKDSVELLLDPSLCSIPGKDFHREEKRCRKCPAFSGAVVKMRFQCGQKTRLVNAKILDRDMFDTRAKTPEHTSYTMQLLERLNAAVGPDVMSKPMFSTGSGPSVPVSFDSELEHKLSSGEYDALFDGEEKPSELYRNAHEHARGIRCSCGERHPDSAGKCSATWVSTGCVTHGY
jgi:hypothetical protein